MYSNDGDGIQVLISGSGIFKMTAKLSTFRQSGGKKPVIAASTALASVQANEKAKGSFSHGDVDAELVYYPVPNADERLLIPAWRIAVNDDVRMVDGYTGEVIEAATRTSGWSVPGK